CRQRGQQCDRQQRVLGGWPDAVLIRRRRIPGLRWRRVDGRSLVRARNPVQGGRLVGSLRPRM
ncbi:hypothetical protein H4217_009093, partial [Coemansia sp. RSA 1939]